MKIKHNTFDKNGNVESLEEEEETIEDFLENINLWH